MNNLRKNTLYYTFGSIIYFFAQWLMTVLMVKLSGFENAGLLSLAMSVTSAPSIVTLFNIRNFQVSDVKEQFISRTYIVSRYFTCILSFIICCGMILVYGYDMKKTLIILSYMIFKVVEGFADVYIGIEQKYERLDLAGISMFIRGIGSIVVFAIVVYLTDNLILANLLMDVMAVLIVLSIDRRFAERFMREHESELKQQNRKDVWNLLYICLPLAIVSFLNNLSLTVPKLILEQYHGETILGIYNSISSPTLVVQLTASTVFAPWIPILSNFYSTGDKNAFNKTVKKISILVLGLTVFCMVSVLLLYKLGLLEWLLVILFAEKIRSYTVWFIPVIIAAILMAVNACLFSMCTLMRKIKSQYLIGLVGIISCYAFSYYFIPKEPMQGVIISIMGSAILQIIVQFVIVVIAYRDKWGRKK